MWRFTLVASTIVSMMPGQDARRYSGASGAGNAVSASLRGKAMLSAHCRTWPLLKRLVEGQIGTFAEIADGLASRAPWAVERPGNRLVIDLAAIGPAR